MPNEGPQDGTDTGKALLNLQPELYRKPGSMTGANLRGNDEARLRAVIDAWAKAVRDKDVDGAMRNYSPDIVAFDAVNPLQKIGAEALKRRVEEWFSAFEGRIGYEIRDLKIVVASDVAFCHSVNRVSGAKVGGGKIDMWVRATVCFCKVDGDWMVTHEHVSVPFDPESGEASFDLEP